MMNLDIMHRNTEDKAKCWLRAQYEAHGTAIPNFTQFDGTAYEKEVAQLASNVFTYVEDKKKYVQTYQIDWK